MDAETLNVLADMIGIVGVALIVAAYALISADKLTSKSARYHLLNLAGAVCILLSLAVHWNLPSFAIEVIWITISLYGMWKWWRGQKGGS